MTWLWPTAARSPQWFVVWSFGLLALALFVVNFCRLLYDAQHLPVQTYTVPPTTAPATAPPVKVAPTPALMPPPVAAVLPAPRLIVVQPTPSTNPAVPQLAPAATAVLKGLERPVPVRPPVLPEFGVQRGYTPSSSP